jgi:hypothetical protein
MGMFLAIGLQWFGSRARERSFGHSCFFALIGVPDNLSSPMAEIFVEVRSSGVAGDLSGQPAIPEAFMSRVEDLGQSLKEIAERLSEQLEDFEKKRAAAWQLERVELKFSLDLEAQAGVVIARTKASAGFEASLSWRSSAV